MITTALPEDALNELAELFGSKRATYAEGYPGLLNAPRAVDDDAVLELASGEAEAEFVDA